MKLYNISVRTIVLFGITVIFIVNYLFYSFLIKKFLTKEKILKEKIKKIENEIDMEKQLFEKNILIFKKIRDVKFKIIKKEQEIEVLKNKLKTEKDISHILKLLTSEVGVTLNNVELFDVKKGKNQVSLFFKFSGTGKLINLIKLIDAIEEKNDLLIIENYSLKKGKTSWTINMTIKTIFMVIE